MTTLNPTKKQYFQPEIIQIGDAVKITLGGSVGSVKDSPSGGYRRRLSG